MVPAASHLIVTDRVVPRSPMLKT